MEGNGVAARLIRTERDIEKLQDKKADYDDVKALAKIVDKKADRSELVLFYGQVQEVKKILLWFMGIVATALIAGFGVVIGILVT